MRAGFTFAKIPKALQVSSAAWLFMPAHRARTGVDVAFVTEFPDLLEESSALAIADEVVWTLNDGNAAVLLPVPARSDTAEIPIGNARNVDWESLAQDETHFLWRTPE